MIIEIMNEYIVADQSGRIVIILMNESRHLPGLRHLEIESESSRALFSACTFREDFGDLRL